MLIAAPGAMITPKFRLSGTEFVHAPGPTVSTRPPYASHSCMVWVAAMKSHAQVTVYAWLAPATTVTVSPTPVVPFRIRRVPVVVTVICSCETVPTRRVMIGKRVVGTVSVLNEQVNHSCWAWAPSRKLRNRLAVLEVGRASRVEHSPSADQDESRTQDPVPLAPPSSRS